MRFALALTALTLSACASTSTIIPEGPDSYLAYKEGATGFSGTAPLKIAATQDAKKHCDSLGKEFMVTASNEIPRGVLGSYPGAEVRFMCLSKGDAELKRPKLMPVPNTVIEVRDR